MSSTFTPEVIEAGSALVGLTLGYVADKKALYDANKEDEIVRSPALQAAMEASTAIKTSQSEETVEEDTKNQYSPSTMDRAKRLASRGILPAVLGLASVSLAYGLTPSHLQTKKAGLEEIAVDNAGTAYPVLNKIKFVVSKFDSLNPTVQLDNGGQLHNTDARDFSSFVDSETGSPSGDSGLDGAINAAFNDEANANEAVSADNELVVITDGDTLLGDQDGNASSIIDQAKQLNTKIDIINVEKSGTPANIIDQYKQVTSLTGGKLYEANQANAEIVSRNAQALTASEKKNVPKQDEWAFIVFSGILTAIGGVFYSTRRRFVSDLRYKR